MSRDDPCWAEIPTPGPPHGAGALPRGARPRDPAVFFAGLVLAASLLCRTDTDAETTRTFTRTGLTLLDTA